MTNNWTPEIRTRALARNVLVVARTRIEGKWAAYVDAVPGINHDNEAGSVLEAGTKLEEQVARAIFPCFQEMPYAP